MHLDPSEPFWDECKIKRVRAGMFRGTKKKNHIPPKIKADLQHYLVLEYKYLPRRKDLDLLFLLRPPEKVTELFKAPSLPAVTNIYVQAHLLE